MMTGKHTSDRSGFTIIEVLFVLAIAGVIMLIVFQAIPVLERNSRNNQRKQDVNLILQSVSHFELNNSGNIPDCGPPAPRQNCDTATNNDPLRFDARNLTFYDVANISINPSGTPSGLPWTDTNSVQVYNYYKCDPQNSGQVTGNGAGFTDVVAIYAIETGNGGTAGLCQQL